MSFIFHLNPDLKQRWTQTSGSLLLLSYLCNLLQARSTTFSMVCPIYQPLFVQLTRRAATDIRTIIDDDVRLQRGIAGALEQYNLDQFVTVGAPDENHQVRSTPLVALSSPRTPGHHQRVWSRWRSKGEQVHRPPLKEVICF